MITAPALQLILTLVFDILLLVRTAPSFEEWKSSNNPDSSVSSASFLLLPPSIPPSPPPAPSSGSGSNSIVLLLVLVLVRLLVLVLLVLLLLILLAIRTSQMSMLVFRVPQI